MRFFLVLAAVSVVSAAAASSGSLRMQSQPLLNQIQAELSSQIRARNSVEAAFQVKFVNAIEEHIAGILDQLQTTVENLQPIVQAVTSHIQAAIAEIQASVDNSIANGQAVATAAIEKLKQILNNLLGTLLGGNDNSFEVPAQFPVLHGALNNLMASSAEVAKARALVASLNLESVLQVVTVRLLGEEVGNQLMVSKGWWGSIWNGIGNVAGNVWNGVTGVAGGIVNGISSVASHAWNSVAEKLEAIRQIAALFLDSSLDVVQAMGHEVAQDLIDMIAPYAQDLGMLASLIVSKLLQVYTGLDIPPALIDLVIPLYM